MSITTTGYFLLILGIYGFFFQKNFLYFLTIFFIPFTATAVINVGNEGEGSSIQPFMFFGTLWMFQFFFLQKRTAAITVFSKSELNSLFFLFGFAFVALLSLCMPIFISGNEKGNATGALNEFIPIVFTLKNVTQYFYLLFGVVFSVAIYIYNKNIRSYTKTIKIYAFSILFVVSWGVLQFVCNIMSFTYPASIFNNSYNKFANGYLEVLDDAGSIKRISSVSVEPSVMVQSILIILPFLIFSVIYKNYIFSKKLDIIFALIIVIFIFISTSSSGILTLIFIMILSTISYYKKSSKKQKSLLFFVGLLIVPIIFALLYALFGKIIDVALFSKSDSYSAIERLSSIKAAWNSFLSHPILGLGWGSITSFDLPVKILSNTGIIGFFFFTMLIITLIKNLNKVRYTLKNFSSLSSSIIITFYSIIFSNTISGFSSVFGFFWLVIGLMMAIKLNP